MADVNEVIGATFEKAEGDDKCKTAAENLRALYEAGDWKSAEILKVVATSREADEAG
jgi:hypothetical protein